MTEKIIINALVDRIKLEHTNSKGKTSVMTPWKINIKNAEYILFPYEEKKSDFNSDLWNLFNACTLQEIKRAFYHTVIPHKYQLRIRNFICELRIYDNIIAKNAEQISNLEKKIDVLENHVAATELSISKQSSLLKAHMSESKLKADLLEKKLDEIADRLNILIGVLDLQNQNASNKI